MLVRPEGDGAMVIGQASHAWMSGQLARAWGNARFDAPDPWEEVCLAAEQHDVGMAEWDLAPELNPETGLPQTFMEMALDDHLRLWSAAPEKLVTQSRYAALLVSLHGTALYGRRDLTRLPAGQAAAVHDYLDGEHARQETLIAQLGAELTQVTRNQRLLLAWDGLSLALCLRWASHVAEGVPAAGEDTTDVRLATPGPGDPDGRFVVDPWPFAGGQLTVRCEGRRLARRFATARDLHAALEAAPHVALAFTLTPPAA